MEAAMPGPDLVIWSRGPISATDDQGDRPMGSEKHRGAPKKQVKKPSVKAKDKQAKKLASQLGAPLQPRPAAGSGMETGGGPS
jgi:hypothetical protein